ncbi:uncharacterized protein [Cardiocondyla obscurior]|uniref:uncharacterized protein n=1 Tax=Cardiocondyla obscurior TaxID=286306 RepID=UPI0039657368
MRKMQSVLTKAEESLQTKDQEIGRLKRKIKEWENKYKSQELLRKKEQQSHANNSEYFYQRCLTLEHKISDMEKFLTDYGLIWVGNSKDTTSVDDDSNNYVDACYEQLVANIDQLNLAAGKGEVHIHHNEKGGGATFKTTSCMTLKLYKNGMRVNEGPLRSYNNPSAISFVRDILDGYFPSELQQDYPDGVPFMIEDHRTVLHVEDSVCFPGQGYRLGKQSPVDNVLSTTSFRSNNVRHRPTRVNSSSKDSTSMNIPLSLSRCFDSMLDSKTSSESPSVNFISLRSQILASHNNACSSSHLQSHINAELALSSRREKRESAMKNIEYDISLNEQSSKSRDTLRSASNSKTRYHSFSDRSSSRSRALNNRFRLRSKSANSPGDRLGIKSILKSKTLSTAGINKIGEIKDVDLAFESLAMKHPRGSKSATSAKKITSPLLRHINEAAGKPNELRLKVRSLTGSTIYLVHILADESVAKLYELLDKAISTSAYKGYKVVLSGYSPKRLHRVNTSLKEIGINRDCVLHLVHD